MSKVSLKYIRERFQIREIHEIKDLQNISKISKGGKMKNAEGCVEFRWLCGISMASNHKPRVSTLEIITTEHDRIVANYTVLRTGPDTIV